MKVTVAPATGVPPFVTTALSGTIPGREKLVAATETATLIEGGAITVAFAVTELCLEVFAAVRFTAYVPTGVPEGAPLPSVIDKDCPGFRVTAEEERDVDQPAGSDDPKAMVLGEQPDESLLVTETE